jgi:hypothetical protein
MHPPAASAFHAFLLIDWQIINMLRRNACRLYLQAITLRVEGADCHSISIQQEQS